MIRRKRAIKIYSLIYAGIFILSVLAIILNAMIIPKENFPPNSMERYDTLAEALESRIPDYIDLPIEIAIDNYICTLLVEKNELVHSYLVYHDENGYIKPLTTIENGLYNMWNYHIRTQVKSHAVRTMFIGDKYCVYTVVSDELVKSVEVIDNLGSAFKMQNANINERNYYLYATTIDQMPANYTVTIDGEVYEPNKWYYDQMLYPNFAFLIMLTMFAFPTGLGIIFWVYQHKYESNRRKYKDIF